MPRKRDDHNPHIFALRSRLKPQFNSIQQSSNLNTYKKDHNSLTFNKTELKTLYYKKTTVHEAEMKLKWDIL